MPGERIGRRKFLRRGAALGVSTSAGFLSWCAVIGVNLLVFPQDQLLAADAGSHDRQTP